MIGGSIVLDKKKLSKMTEISEVVLTQIEELALKNNIKKVILFGSRARGDYKKRSDIDLAVIGGDVPEFTLAVDEETTTLLMYDIVDLGRAVQSELLESINRDGVVLYEKI